MQECIGFLKLVRLRLKSVVAFGAGKPWLMLYRVFFFMSMIFIDRGLTDLKLQRRMAVIALINTSITVAPIL